MVGIDRAGRTHACEHAAGGVEEHVGLKTRRGFVENHGLAGGEDGERGVVDFQTLVEVRRPCVAVADDVVLQGVAEVDKHARAAGELLLDAVLRNAQGAGRVGRVKRHIEVRHHNRGGFRCSGGGTVDHGIHSDTLGEEVVGVAGASEQKTAVPHRF